MSLRQNICNMPMQLGVWHDKWARMHLSLHACMHQLVAQCLVIDYSAIRKMDSSYFNKGAHSAQELLFQVCHGGLSIVVNDLSLKLA